MKAMSKASEIYQAPPPGLRPGKIIEAVEQVAKSGASMIKLLLEDASAEFAGGQSNDYLITDGNAKGAGMAKAKFRGLGVDVDSDIEIPDAVLCQQLLGRTVMVDWGNEQINDKDAAGGYTIPRFVTDPKTGAQVAVMKLTIKGYSTVGLGGVAPGAQHAHAQQHAPAPQYQQAPPMQAQQYAQPPAPQYAPQAQAPQYAPPQAQQYAPPQQAYAQAPQQQYAAPQPAFAAQVPQQGFAPPAPPPWANNGAAPAPVATGEAEETKKRGKGKLQIPQG